MMGVGTLYGKSINELVVELYWQALQRFDFADVKEALQACVANPDSGQFMPKPADVVRYLEGSSQTQALRAWSAVVEAIRRVGGGTSVVFDDFLIHAVISDMGGWIGLCRVMEEELPFRGNEFTKRYAGFVAHPPLAYPKQLTGFYEQQNCVNGQPVDPLVFIGDREKAVLVHQGGSDAFSLPIAQLTQQLSAISNQNSEENLR